jgi:hypothetical protein
LQTVTIRKKQRHKNRNNRNNRKQTEAMKTIETMKTEKAMKTKTNFRKAALRTAAVIVSFVLVSFTVSAQEFWKKLLTNSSFNEIAIAMVETKNEGATTGSGSDYSNWDYFDKAFDPALELENWMMSSEYFELVVFHVETETEAPLAVESWMLNSRLFEVYQTAEEPLELESWMTSYEFWGI